jgi:hypothetical protein
MFGGNPFVDGIYWATTCCCLRPPWWESLDGWDFLGHNLLLSQASLVGIPRWMGFWLSGSLFHELFFFDDGILAITEPFSGTFSFFTMEFRLSGSLSHEPSFFFTMEFQLSGSLSHELYLFSRWNFGYHGAFLTIFFFFTMEFRLSGSLSHELFFLFHDGILETHNLGEDSFYIYIRKSIYTGSASLKTLPLDLEPLCKEKSMVLLILIRL